MLSRRGFLKGVAASAALATSPLTAFGDRAKSRPNIVFILSDDIGYGDVGCYGATKVKTPNIDRLAAEGVRFTDAHTPAAVCTPTRYGFLTGRYPWRNSMGDHILSGVAPLAIDPASTTIPSFLKKAGYATGLVGKWHLGLGTKDKPVDYNRKIAPGPPDIGFDYSFYIPATADRVPCVFVENRHVVGLDSKDPIHVSYEGKIGDDPTGAEHPELLKMKADPSHSKTIVNGISRIGYMSGGKAARWVDEDIADTLTHKAIRFIEENKARPFFLYLATSDIHEPMAPNARFKGKSGCGTRGDAIEELDWCVGEVLNSLDRLGLASNTLVIFTSDNGGAIKDTYDDGTNSLHALQAPNGNLRGTKGTLYEGGHRVPFVARWPEHTQAGTQRDDLIGLIDMLATFAAVVDQPLLERAGPDSVNVLPALLGAKTLKPVRDNLVFQNNGMSPLAIRKGPWVLITKRFPPESATTATDGAELYNLAEDPAQKTDLASKEPEKVRELTALLDSIRAQGSSHT